MIHVCGIFGAVSFHEPFSDVEVSEFLDAVDMVHYRGPDNRDFFLSGDRKVFLGHRRLSIIDLSSEGNQPLIIDDMAIIYNGEIFNYLELRKELENLGVSFKTNTDTEVILKVYEKYGTRGFEKLNGMWAFAILDMRQKRLILSRDRFGIKPLHYMNLGDRLFFASEIKQLLPFLPKKEVSEEQMLVFLERGITDYDENTFIKGINKVEAKHSLIVDLDTGKISEEKYWDYEFKEISSFDSAVEEFRELFFDSVRLRLRSDVKLGALLSGGLDSSSIVLATTKFMPVESYSVITREKKYSEEKYIDLLSSFSKIENKKMFFVPSQVLENLYDVIYHQDEPFGGLSIVAQHMIFRKIKDETDVKVVLSGQGADEVLMGYLKYYFMYLKSLLNQGAVLSLTKEILASLVNRTAIWYIDKKAIIRRFFSSPSASFVKDEQQLSKQLLTASSLRKTQILDIDRYSIPALTRYEDRNSMANSIEVRNPFLDHRLVNFCLSLPDNYKIRNGWSKFILRASMQELPKEIRWRRDKKGFVTPEEVWLKGQLRPIVEAAFKKSLLGEHGFIDVKNFMDIYHLFLNNKGSVRGSDISRTLIAELWLKEFFGVQRAPMNL